MEDNVPKKPDKKEKFSLTAEPILLVYNLCTSAAGTVTSDLYVRQFCASYGYSASECLNNSTLEDTALSMAAYYLSAGMYLMMFVPSCVFIFIGGWSETYGRKKYIIIALFGETVYWAMYAFLASLENLSPQFLLLPTVAIILTGGGPTIQALSTCILSDVTTYNNRSVRMAVGVGSSSAGMFIGLVSAVLLFDNGSYFGYIYVYSVNTFLTALSLLYAIFLLKEPINVDKNEAKGKLFVWKYVIGFYQVPFKKRPIRQKIVVFLLFFFVFINAQYNDGEISILFLSAKKAFKWDVGTYNYFGIALYTYRSLVTFGTVWLITSYFKIKDLPFLAGTLLFLCGATVMCANVTTVTTFCIAFALASCINIPSAIIKSIITKTVTPGEIGSAMALLALIENLGMPISGSIYAAVFSLVESSSPFIANYASTIFSFIGLVVISCVFGIEKSGFIQNASVS